MKLLITVQQFPRKLHDILLIETILKKNREAASIVTIFQPYFGVCRTFNYSFKWIKNQYMNLSPDKSCQMHEGYNKSVLLIHLNNSSFQLNLQFQIHNNRKQLNQYQCIVFIVFIDHIQDLGAIFTLVNGVWPTLIKVQYYFDCLVILSAYIRSIWL